MNLVSASLPVPTVLPLFVSLSLFSSHRDSSVDYFFLDKNYFSCVLSLIKFSSYAQVDEYSAKLNHNWPFHSPSVEMSMSRSTIQELCDFVQREFFKH